MAQIAVRTAKDLQVPARQWVESLFGRALREDEEVAVFVIPPRPVPSAAVRQEALGRLTRILDQAAESMKGVPNDEFEAAVEEAMQQVRRREG